MPSSLATATTSSTSGIAYIGFSPCAKGSERRASQHPWIDLASNELPIAGRAQQLAIRHHDFPSQDHRRRPALDLPASPGAVIPHVQIAHAQRLLDGRIDD